ncbi:MAG: hypothetical protein OEO21_03260 [Candidatus Krumholzibacteria bacterium]|nr:hypothetical protein [Candidatus Krumholzibacteria bacterium]
MVWLAVLAALCPPGAPRADDVSAGGRLTGRAEVGYDSFEERYSIVDADTVDGVNEVRSRLRLAWSTGSVLGNLFLVEARALLGEDNHETGARARLVRRFAGHGRSQVSFEGDATRREFGASSPFAFPNDFTRLYGRAVARVGVHHALALRLDGRLEDLDFSQRTEFDCDHTRASVALGGEYDHDLTTYGMGGVRYTTMQIPDSTEIEYHSWMPVLEIRSTPELRQQLYLTAALERRLYDDSAATRSDFWALFAALLAEWPLGDRVSLELRDDLEHYGYDVNTDAYFDYVENRTALLFNYNGSWAWRVGAGPAFAFLASSQSEQDEYVEWGAMVRVEYIRGARAWAAVEYAPGRRLYSSFDPAAIFDFDSIFSDYTFHRLTAFAGVRVWRGLGVDLFADYQPEDHEREGDDATATLLSVSLSYAF